MNNRLIVRCTFLLAVTFYSITTRAQKDTLRVMAYNVLYYGNGCQGPAYQFHHYLETITSYTNPDILSLEKMGSIPINESDKYGTTKPGFADSVVKYALDAAYPGRYAHSPYTNEAHNTNMAVVFYDRHKLGFLSIVSSYVNVTDFNIFKFYYKDPSLERTHDTTFLYIIPNHDLSGDKNEKVRGVQIAGVMRMIKTHFSSLPNMIDLGDFNARTSDEPFYQALTADDNKDFRFSDPPFFPDRKLSYPANWDHDSKYTEYFTTSTRESASEPNSCGTGGGAKNWYDHIFLSPWIVNNVNNIRYIPNSYRTIGNDGQRYMIGIANKNTHENMAAPAAVIEALYQMSNKYPVMVDLEVTPGAKAIAGTEIQGARDAAREQVIIDNLVYDAVIIHLPADLLGQEITIDVLDKTGAVAMTKTKKIKDTEMEVKCNISSGNYTVKITGHHNTIAEANVIKK